MKKIVTALLAFTLLFSLFSFAIELEDDEISVTGWKFETSSTNANNGVPAEVPERVIDGNGVSHWHSMINPKAELPHTFTVILPQKTKIGGLRYTPRQDGSLTGTFLEYNIYASNDGTNFYKISSGTWGENSDVKTVSFDKNLEVTAVKLEATKTVGGYGSIGELRLLKPIASLKDGDIAIYPKKEIKEPEPEPIEPEKVVTEEYVLIVNKPEFTYSINGTTKTDTFDAPPMIYKDRTMIPLRGLLEAMGAQVTWVEETQNVEIKTEDVTLLLRIEDDRLYKNGKRYNFDVKPMIVNDRTMVPLRFVTEHLGYSVAWDGDTQTITITK